MVTIRRDLNGTQVFRRVSPPSNGTTIPTNQVRTVTTTTRPRTVTTRRVVRFIQEE